MIMSVTVTNYANYKLQIVNCELGADCELEINYQMLAKA